MISNSRKKTVPNKEGKRKKEVTKEAGRPNWNFFNLSFDVNYVHSITWTKKIVFQSNPLPSFSVYIRLITPSLFHLVFKCRWNQNSIHRPSKLWVLFTKTFISAVIDDVSKTFFNTQGLFSLEQIANVHILNFLQSWHLVIPITFWPLVSPHCKGIEFSIEGNFYYLCTFRSFRL